VALRELWASSADGMAFNELVVHSVCEWLHAGESSGMTEMTA